MSVYRIEAQPMPWGYGFLLASGMSRHLGRSAGGLLQLERTGPFVPPISFPGPDVIVTDSFRAELASSGLTGLEFAPIVKARIVELHWERWDRSAEDPPVYPNEPPEGYILERPHSAELAERMGPLWELVATRDAAVDRIHLGPNAWDEQLVVKPSGRSDSFRAEGVGFTYVSQPALDWLTARAGEWVRGEPIPPHGS